MRCGSASDGSSPDLPPKSPSLLNPSDLRSNVAVGLRRYQQTGDLHLLTFSCYHREQKVDER